MKLESKYLVKVETYEELRVGMLVVAQCGQERRAAFILSKQDNCGAHYDLTRCEQATSFRTTHSNGESCFCHAIAAGTLYRAPQDDLEEIFSKARALSETRLEKVSWPFSHKLSAPRLTCDTCGGPIAYNDEAHTVTCVKTGKLLPRWNDDDWHHEVSSDE